MNANQMERLMENATVVASLLNDLAKGYHPTDALGRLNMVYPEVVGVWDPATCRLQVWRILLTGERRMLLRLDLPYLL